MKVYIFCNIKKHESYLDIDYEQLQNFNFVQSDEIVDNAEFSMIILNLLDLDLEDSDNVSNLLFVSTIIDNLPLPNEQLYEMYSQLNKAASVKFYNTACIALQISRKEKWASTKTVSNIFKWGCWCWRKLFNQGNNRMLESAEISKPKLWSTICSCDCIYRESCYRHQ